jgi:hypothetical protein
MGRPPGGEKELNLGGFVPDYHQESYLVNQLNVKKMTWGFPSTVLAGMTVR